MAAVKVPDRNVQELREQGFTIVEGFLAPDELEAAQEALWLHYPRPEEYFADPSAHQEYARSQFDGDRPAPWQSWDLNRLAFHPDLVDLAERFLGSADLHLYNALLWAKYGGAVDYEQVHHRDFVNHSLVVPDRTRPRAADDGVPLAVRRRRGGRADQGGAARGWRDASVLADGR